LQQLPLHSFLVALDLLCHSAHPTRINVTAPIADEEDLLELHLPRNDAFVIEEKQSFKFELILNELDHAAAPVPAIHELNEQVVLEEVVLLELAVELVLVDEVVEGREFAVPHHAVAADGDVAAALLLLAANLKLVYAGDPHVEELLTLRLLQHGYYFGDIEYLVAHEVGDGIVDGFPALHLDGRQHFDRLYALSHLPHVDDLLRLVLDLLHHCRFPVQRRQPQVRDRPVARTRQQADVFIPLPVSFLRDLLIELADDPQLLHGGGLQLQWFKLDVEAVLEPFLIDIHS
jgi:hypothetical protein